MKKAQTTRVSACEISVTNQSGFCHHAQEKQILSNQRKTKTHYQIKASALMKKKRFLVLWTKQQILLQQEKK